MGLVCVLGGLCVGVWVAWLGLSWPSVYGVLLRGAALSRALSGLLL